MSTPLNGVPDRDRMIRLEPPSRGGPSRGNGQSGIALAAWMACSLLAGAVGAMASIGARDFYAALARPSWAPPGWLFAPVWTFLYLLMGAAAWLVWSARPASADLAASRRLGLRLFVVQLALNALWTWLFFAWRQGAWAFAEILLLLVTIVATVWQFARVRRLAAWYLAPYLSWVAFATALSWAVWQGNPGLL